MSKKKKASAGKAGKASPVKKPAKKVNGGANKGKTVVAKKPAPKKPLAKPSKSAKPTASKKSSKPAPKKVSKAPVKKVAPKKVQASSKKVKPVVKAKTSVSAKKVPVKPVPVKKAVVKVTKTVAKPAPKPVAKPAPKAKASEPAKVSAPKPASHAPVKTTAKAAPAEDKHSKTEETANKKQLLEKKSQEVLAISNTIPVKHKSEISASKIASIAHSITNPVKRLDSYSVKPEKEPNGKFEMEFVVHASAEMLYEFLSTPSGLSEWFCDDLNIRNGIYTFIWEDQMQQARLLKTMELQMVRFQWVDKVDGSYFEFRIQRDDLTNDISLIITDFAETVSERESSKLLWHSQIEKLMHVIGSIF